LNCDVCTVSPLFHRWRNLLFQLAFMCTSLFYISIFSIFLFFFYFMGFVPAIELK